MDTTQNTLRGGNSGKPVKLVWENKDKRTQDRDKNRRAGHDRGNQGSYRPPMNDGFGNGGYGRKPRNNGFRNDFRPLGFGNQEQGHLPRNDGFGTILSL
jgi:hypothetical protein